MLKGVKMKTSIRMLNLLYQQQDLVMAFIQGKKIEVKRKAHGLEWKRDYNPTWDWSQYQYRIME